MQKDGTPERTRTSDLVFRKHPLYPTELREHNGGDVPLASVGWGHGTVKVGQAKKEVDWHCQFPVFWLRLCQS